jgi:hypothetical protein
VRPQHTGHHRLLMDIQAAPALVNDLPRSPLLSVAVAGCVRTDKVPFRAQPHRPGNTQISWTHPISLGDGLIAPPFERPSCPGHVPSLPYFHHLICPAGHGA